MVRRREAPAILDVRERNRYEAGHPPGTVHTPDSDTGGLVLRLHGMAEAILVCDDGRVSMMVARTLGFCGYRGVKYLEGGLKAWTAAGGPLLEIAPSGAERPISTHREGATGRIIIPVIEACSMKTLFLGLAASIAVVACAFLFLR